MIPPRFEFVRAQNAGDGVGRNALHSAIGYQLASEFRTIPLRERACHLVGSFTRQFDEMEGHLWCKDGSTASSGFLKQTCYPMLVKAFGPFADMVCCQPHPCGGLTQGVALLLKEHGSSTREDPH